VPRRVRTQQGLEVGKTTLKLIFNNPGSSIKSESAPDPNIFPPTTVEQCVCVP